MKRYQVSLGCILIAAGMMAAGCQETSPTGVASTTHYEHSDFDAERPQFRFRFTGRDSFGVSLRASLAGTVEPSEESECQLLTGSGHATHLGKTSIAEHTVCIEGEEVTGRFTFEGRSGGLLEGSYVGTLKRGTFKANMTIETAGVSAVQEEPTETPTGKGTLTGTLTETRFRYRIEGWLFHHSRDQRVGVVD